ncbi:hypothetical protein [Aquabacterium sp. NJ1]|nr:hypothetical protein [Aquabacterium sp. NJ1]
MRHFKNKVAAITGASSGMDRVLVGPDAKSLHLMVRLVESW